MKRRRCTLFMIVLAMLCGRAAAPASETPVPKPADGAEAVDYATHIKPIFQRYCYDCHAGKKPSSGYRVDTGLLSIRGGDRGPAVVPGKSAESVLFQALVGKGDVARMPQDSDPLPADDIEKIRRWIDAGAKTPANEVASDGDDDAARHWAFQPIRRPPLPVTAARGWVVNPIDAFVLARLEAEKLSPSREAPRATLIRRLSLDLRGLPPSLEEIDQFVNDAEPGAYERLVDRMLASPHYGERWGRHWLDLARYADSNGFTIDGARSIWKYRDWVIQAFNDDKPFDQFTIEQLAGDLLPGRTIDQRIATGFHRNTLVNEEGGTDQEQFRVEAVVDRVSTTGAVWMGLTVGCAQCHEHKYDPISQREFYELFALLNTCEEPKLPVPSPEQSQRMTELGAAIADAEKRLKAHDLEAGKRMPEWEKETAERARAAAEWTILEPAELKSEKGSVLATQDDRSIFVDFSTPPNDVFVVTAEVALPTITALRLEAMTNSSLPMNGPGRAEDGNFVLSEFELLVAPKGEAAPDWKPVKLAKAVADHSQEGYSVTDAIDGKTNTGWSIGVRKGSLNVNREAVFFPAAAIENAGGSRLMIRLRHDHSDAKYLLGRFRLSASSAAPDALAIPAVIREVVLLPVEKRTADQKQQLEAAFRDSDSARKPLADEVGSLMKSREQLVKEIPTTLVLEERAKARETRIMIRGDFLRTGAKVSGGVPSFLPPLAVEKQDPNRLDLAKWLVSPEHPLTARVHVNRIWQQLFGAGIVTTENDFGVQAAPPSHAELLDWLASEFRAPSGSAPASSGQAWSMKHLIRLIVTSATYRQDSVVTAEKLERDPANRWLSRQSRLRLEAELVRDVALEASGVLTDRLGGPSVYPPQPEGIYVLTQVKKAWPESQGADRYRRGMYTYFWRSSPYPLMPTFDAPDANNTCTRRTRSNTPLQALTLANDRSFVELARAFAERILREASPYDEARARHGFRTAIAREPEPAELERLLAFVASQRRTIAESAAKPEAKPANVPEGMSADDLAVWTATARVLMNLDEFITRE